MGIADLQRNDVVLRHQRIPSRSIPASNPAGRKDFAIIATGGDLDRMAIYTRFAADRPETATGRQ